MDNGFIRAMAMNMINSNPNIANNPNNRAAIQAIMNNDANAGMQLANQICQNMGMDKNQAISQASQFFNLK